MAKTMKEIGSEGIAGFYGQVQEVYNSVLEWPGAYSTYNEMRRRDPTLRAILNAIKLLARQATWTAEPATDSAADRQAAEFLQQCIEDMSHTVTDFIDDALTCLPFGWASFEVVYKRRAGDKGKTSSQFTDGKIGWRKFAFRRQSTLERWDFDDDGDGAFSGWVQQAPPMYKSVSLPIEKLLHFTGERDGTNPEGISLFESAYEPYHFVTNLQIIGGIGWQRTFVGLPVFAADDEMTPSDVSAAQAVGQALTVDEKQYVIVPHGFTFDLEHADNSGASALLEWIRHFRIQMAQLVLADFIFLGSGNVGSWALGSDKSLMFLMAVNGILDRIADVWNRYGVARLFGYNEFAGVSEMPQIAHSLVRKPNLPELGEFLAQIEPLITIGDEDELWVRDQAGMPEIDLEELRKRREEKDAKAADIAAQMQPAQGQQPPGGAEPETGQDENDADELAELAEPELTEEEKARRRVEAQFARDVRRFLREQESRVLDELNWAGYEWDNMMPEFWSQEQSEFAKAVIGDLTKDISFLLKQAAGLVEDEMGSVGDWTLANASAAKWARKHVGTLIKGVTKTTRNNTKEAVANWVESGEDLPALKRLLGQTFSPVRAEMIASTEVTNAYSEANDLVYQESGLPGTEYRPAAHVRCILPGNEVAVPGLIAGAKSFYVGRAIEIRTAGGRVLTVTKNHPILTAGGWMAAGLVNKGDNVIVSTGTKRIALSVYPDYDHVPAAVEQVYRALEESAFVTSSRVPAAAEDLYGDGRYLNGDVNVVYPDRSLLGDRETGAAQLFSQYVLDRGSVGQSALFAQSDLELASVRLRDAPRGSVSGSRLPSALVRRHSGPFYQFGGVPSTNGDLVFEQGALDDAAADAPHVRKFLGRFASDIATDQVVSVREFDFSGHVYDLQSEIYGLYTCNGVIVKNCRCWTRPVLLPNDEWVIAWQTATDEKVCTQPLDTPWGTILGCSGMQGRIVSGGTFRGRLLDDVRAEIGNA